MTEFIQAASDFGLTASYSKTKKFFGGLEAYSDRDHLYIGNERIECVTCLIDMKVDKRITQVSKALGLSDRRFLRIPIS